MVTLSRDRVLATVAFPRGSFQFRVDSLVREPRNAIDDEVLCP